MIEYTLKSFKALCYNRTAAGDPYSQAIVKNSIDLVSAFNQDARNEPVNGLAAVISIPRGGVSTARGVFCALQEMENCSPELVTSRIKTDPDNLYPEDMFEELDTLIITDGVTASGSTILTHLDQIPGNWNGQALVLTNACSQVGAMAIRQWGQDQGRDVNLVTARIFKDFECEWVNMNGKAVYFVGSNSENGIDYQLPDFGDHIQPPAAPVTTPGNPAL